MHRSRGTALVSTQATCRCVVIPGPFSERLLVSTDVPRHQAWAAWAKKKEISEDDDVISGTAGGGMVMSRLIIKATVPALGKSPT